ncbi:hypothetical protein GFS24_11455 [Chitinophaga sp. SYP-B3965]|uniref:hypothetical protein n=1 Tax=Chitinophaga sp. SYP-B3965 TaxID=2663120 RepID=UPI001299E932|nr:hypothetical protein [Chitinophaga sp. SYP-B3965]MRG45736.1 hypothetical protein [Chitinophaga sp. SYP-B3965]
MTKTPKKAAKPKAKKPEKAPAKTAAKKTRSATATREPSFDVATRDATSVKTTVNITFTSGTGQVTTSLFRKGILINLQSTSVSADIFLSDTKRGDVLSVVGVATGSATITITPVQTIPATPDKFSAGPVMGSYVIL